MVETLGKDGFMLAIALVAAGDTPERAWFVADRISRRLQNRPYSALVTIDELREFAALITGEK